MKNRILLAALVLAIGTGTAAIVAAPALAQDGASRSDRMERRAEKTKKRFERLDRNGDGVVDRSEIERPLQRSFKRADKNGDGVLDEGEIEALKNRPSRRGGPKRGERLAKRLQRADRDRDGRVTEQEFMRLRPGWFRRADRDRDGAVTSSELQSFIDNPRRGGRRNRD